MAAGKVDYESVPKDEKNDAHQDPPLPPKPKGFGVRHMQTLILFASITTAFTMKSQLSVLMVAMVNQTSHEVTRNTSVTCAQHLVSQNNSLDSTSGSWSVYRQYDWNKSTQELITFAFFVGYTSMMLPMGVIAQKFGGKFPIMVALGVNGLICILTPWIALLGGWVGVSVGRLVQGLTQAAIYPSIHTMLGKWAPQSEKGRLSTYIYSGSQLGTIVAFQLSGLFAGIPILSWPSSFWFFGGCSLICCVMMGIFGAATPHEHPNITSEEIAYIMEDGRADVVPKKRTVPWKHILTSKSVWGLICAQTGTTCGYLVVLTEIPHYMKNVLLLDIKSNGLLSSLPFVAMYIMALVFGYLSDFVNNRQLMSVVNIRRTANSLGLVVSGIFLIAFSYVNNIALAIVLLIISLGLYSAVYVGFHINQIDLAPNFAGSIMALGNMIANLTGLLVPVVVSYIVNDDVGDQGKWRIVFFIFVGFQVLTNAIFVIFARGTVQPWNYYGEEGKELENLSVVEEKQQLKH